MADPLPVAGSGDDAARVLDALKAWGTHPTSFQILEAGNLYWFDPAVPPPGAVIAYHECGKYRVAAGVPIAPPELVGSVAARFIAEGRSAGLKTLFFSADDTFLAALAAAAPPPQGGCGRDRRAARVGPGPLHHRRPGAR